MFNIEIIEKYGEESLTLAHYPEKARVYILLYFLLFFFFFLLRAYFLFYLFFIGPELVPSYKSHK